MVEPQEDWKSICLHKLIPNMLVLWAVYIDFAFNCIGRLSRIFQDKAVKMIESRYTLIWSHKKKVNLRALISVIPTWLQKGCFRFCFPYNNFPNQQLGIINQIESRGDKIVLSSLSLFFLPLFFSYLEKMANEKCPLALSCLSPTL